MYGFYGRLLRLNLSDRSFAVEELPESVYRDYLGGKGLGTYLLLRELEPGIDPLSPANKLIIAIGPATKSISGSPFSKEIYCQ